MDLGIVGNCQFNALIDTKGAVKWLCWPRFDSTFIFGSLLDEKQGGEFTIASRSGAEGVQSYITNTNVLRTIHREGDDSFEVIDFAPRFQQYQRYYKPTMLVRIVRPLTGEPTVKVTCKPVHDYGKGHCEATFGSNHIRYSGAEAQLRLTTNASLNMVHESRPFVLDKTYYFVLTYGQPLEEDLHLTCEAFLERTLSYWQGWVKHSHLPRKYQKEVVRSALVLKLHQFEDTGAIIAATTTSIPEAEGTVRNWDYRYCWLRDALFSLGALQRLTHFEELERFTVYLRNIVATLEGSETNLQPVYGVAGEAKLTESILDHLAGYRGHQPVRIGNQAHEHLQHDAYGEMILAISRLFLDIRFRIDKVQYPVALIEALLDHVETYMDSPDAGLWEFRGREQVHTFTVLMHWAGATIAEAVGDVLVNEQLKARGTKLAADAKSILENQCWDPKRKAFTQAVGSDQMDASLLMLINLGYLQPDDPRAASQIEAIQADLGTDHGLIHRYKHQDDFGDTHNSFTICSFWLVEALARIGRNSEAEKILEQLISCSNHLGLYSEDIHPKTKTQWGNFPQTYSHVGLINAAFNLSGGAHLPGLWDFSR